MENRPLETEEPILLNYRMPIWERVLLVLLCASAFVGLMLTAMGLSFAIRDLAVGVPVAFLLLLLIGALSSVIVGANCTSLSIEVDVVVGLRQMRVAWTDVRRFQRVAGPLVLLDLMGRQWYLLGLPADVRDRLIAILRETSNARIIGFDQGWGD